MRQTRSLAAALLLLALALPPARAQGASTPPPEPDAEETVPAAPSEDQLHDELRAVRTAMETALNGKDIDGILAHVTDDVLFTTMNGDVVRGPEAIREYFSKMMEGEDRIVDDIRATFQPAALSILYGGTVAIAYGTTDDRYELTAGTTFNVQALWSCTLLRQQEGPGQEGAWKIASFHYSTNMFDNPILSAQRRFLLWVGVAVALLLAAVGFVLGRRGRR
jgi:uncharacterized protein (TIGR02246 family)